MLRRLLPATALAIAFAHLLSLSAQDAPRIGLTLSNQQATIKLPLYPAVEEFRIHSTTNLASGFSPDLSGQISGFTWTSALSKSNAFYQLEIRPLSSNALLSATVLNRLAYGPTPDELERITAIGPQAWIDEQLNPETIQETLDFDEVKPPIGPGWQYVTHTAIARRSLLYIYLEGEGDAYIDDLMFVRGTNAGVGPNLIRNGNFEGPLSTNDWVMSADYATSSLNSNVVHGGQFSLRIVATDDDGGSANSINQTMTGLVTNQVYTLSYWVLQRTKPFLPVTVRLSGADIDPWDGEIYSSVRNNPLGTRLNYGVATANDLRAWHVLRAVRSKRQLEEILLQFLENHFVTQVSKSRDYFDRYYEGGIASDFPSTFLEYKEIQRWRQALRNPQCTFHDLLKISAESPAMIIYLDTVDSKGHGSNIANENYARELLELFTFGVDNGYDQRDIEITSRAWTGWSVNIVDEASEFNPFAVRSINPSRTAPVDELIGVWTFNYKQANHNTAAKVIFPAKTVPARFGAPYAGRSYQLSLPSRTGTNGIRDGYEVVAHLADQPFTQEYISVKLCRLFVHEDFHHGIYDFTDPNLSAEGKLVRACMDAWENSSPKGQIRKVLATIFNSELFRSHGGALHKVKTPFEFTVGALRALRAARTDGTYTAETDGFAMRAPMQRMGDMDLFDRAEPDGYPESAGGWISAGTLAERLRFVQSLCMTATATGKADAGAANVTDPVGLLKMKLPSTYWNNPAAIADYFISLIYPAEGRANLQQYHALAVELLNTADDGVTRSAFSALSNTSSTYDNRVRGMVGTLMTLQRFQEQ